MEWAPVCSVTEGRRVIGEGEERGQGEGEEGEGEEGEGEEGKEEGEREVG